LRRTWTFPTFSKRPSTSPYWLPIQVQLCLGSENSTYKSLRGDRTDHDWSDQINICMKVFSVAQLRVNDTVGHTTCPVCSLKSHILQTRLTGHTTCETCALEVTNRSVVRFFVKKPIMRWAWLDSFLHLTPWPKIMWYNFIFLIFFRVNCKKKVRIKIFFSQSAFLPEGTGISGYQAILKISWTYWTRLFKQFWIFLRRTNRLDIQIWIGLFTSPSGSIVILEIRGLKFESHGRQYRIFAFLN
jgi:hypothetical protein